MELLASVKRWPRARHPSSGKPHGGIGPRYSRPYWRARKAPPDRERTRGPGISVFRKYNGHEELGLGIALKYNVMSRQLDYPIAKLFPTDLYPTCLHPLYPLPYITLAYTKPLYYTTR